MMSMAERLSARNLHRRLRKCHPHGQKSYGVRTANIVMKIGEGYRLNGCRAWICELGVIGIALMQRGEPMAEITVPINVNLPDDWVEQIVNRLRNDPDSEWVEVTRCKDCKWFNDIGCAIRIVDDTDKPSEKDYCSFAERITYDEE